MVAQASKKYFTWKEDDVNCGNKSSILPFTLQLILTIIVSVMDTAPNETFWLIVRLSVHA